jgi:dihydrofolate synthase/folylpolyglutamate synthase
LNGDQSLGDLLAWLDRHINLEAVRSGRAGRAGEPSLERIRLLTSLLGDPERVAPVIQVTGTNGKGSTTRMVAALLAAHGLSVGTYLSPHLERLNERIAVDSVPVSDEELKGLLLTLCSVEEHQLAQLSRRGLAALPPTWFELMTAAAFLHFANVAVQAMVLEVGLGGRFDATNVADALVACVTNIELDHTEILGPTRELIAAEKAGILKSGATLVLGEEDPHLAPIFEAEARAVGAAGILRKGVDFGVRVNRIAHGGRQLDLATPLASYDDLFLSLHGPHQADNAVVALTAVETFFGRPLDPAIVSKTLRSVAVPGRLEVVGHRPLVLLDGAHNPAGAAALGAALADDFALGGRILIVFGCLAGREPGELLGQIAAAVFGRVEEVFACAPPSPRALPATAVVEAAETIGLPATCYETVAGALEAAIGRASPTDLVLVTGSLYLVGAARSLLG